MIGFLLANWKTLLTVLLIGGLVIDDGLLRIDYAEQKATIAQKDTALKAMQEKQAENIAAAEKKARDAMQRDIDAGKEINASLQAQAAKLQGDLDAALAAQNSAPDTPTCDATPSAQSFDRSLQLLIGGTAASH